MEEGCGQDGPGVHLLPAQQEDSKASVSLSSTSSSGDPSLSSLFQKSPRLGGARDCQDSGRQRGPSSGLEQRTE